jgi:hypothetical protein
LQLAKEHVVGRAARPAPLECAAHAPRSNCRRRVPRRRSTRHAAGHEHRA